MTKKQLNLGLNIKKEDGAKQPLAPLMPYHPANQQDRTITFDEILLGQTSIVAPDGALLETRINPDTKQEYTVKKYNHLVCTQAGDLRSVKMEIETLPSEGLTDYFDDRVILALHTLALQKDTHIYKTSISEIAQVLSLPLNGEYIARIRTSLKKLNSTSIWSEQFIDPESGEAITQRVYMLPQYKLYRDELRSKVVKRNGVLFDEKVVYKRDFTIEINQFFFRSLKQQKILLDIDVLNTFRNKTIEKLYRFLNTVFHSEKRIDLDMVDFCELLGVAVPQYISNIKRNLYVRYIKDIEGNKIIQPFDFKRNFYRKDKVWRVFFERGDHYSSLNDRFEMKPYLFDIYSFLHYTLGFKKQESHTIMGNYEADIIHPHIHYLRLAMKITPKQIRHPRAWLKRSLEEEWDHSANVEILELLDAQKMALTAYQRSWDKADFNQEERGIFLSCVENLGIHESVALRWLKLHENFDYIQRLKTIKSELKPEEQRPEYLVTMIRSRDARVWRIAAPGSEHERSKAIEDSARVGGKSYEDIKGDVRAGFAELFPDEIVVVPDTVPNENVRKDSVAQQPATTNASPPAHSSPPIIESTSTPLSVSTGNDEGLIQALMEKLGNQYPAMFGETYLDVEKIFSGARVTDQKIITQTTLQKMKNKYLSNEN